MADIVEVIKSQHRQVEQLLEQAQSEKSDTLTILAQVKALLLPHSQAEESFVYPRISELDSKEREEVADGAAEHHHVEQLLEELLSEDPQGPGYDGKLAAMVGELQHHVEEEEGELLPVLSRQAHDEERAALAARFLDATAPSSRSKSPAAPSSSSDATKAELYAQAQEQDIPGRSAMSKDELAEAVQGK